MKLFTILILFCSLNAFSQSTDEDTLNQGECWNVEYLYSKDFKLRKYRIEIQYLNKVEFVLIRKCLVADSFSLFNNAMLFGRKGNSNEMTITPEEQAFLDSNNLVFDVNHPVQPKLMQSLLSQPNIECFVDYSTESIAKSTLPINLYFEIRSKFQKLIEHTPKSDGEGIFTSEFCTIGCEGCLPSGELNFEGTFPLFKNLDVMECP